MAGRYVRAALIPASTSRGNSWLWVRSGGAHGPTLYEGTLLQGKTLPVDLKNGPVWIRFGYAPAVDVRLGDDEYPPVMGLLATLAGRGQLEAALAQTRGEAEEW